MSPSCLHNEGSSIGCVRACFMCDLEMLLSRIERRGACILKASIYGLL